HPPFDDRAHDHCLIFEICEGLRPQISPKMSDDYAQMIQKCWDVDPSKRPTTEELLRFAKNKLKEFYKSKSLMNNNTNLIKRLLKSSKIKKDEIDFIDEYNSNSNGVGGSNNSSSLQVRVLHPLAYHTSRILDDEIAKSKSLKSDDSSLSDLD